MLTTAGNACRARSSKYVIYTGFTLTLALLIMLAVDALTQRAVEILYPNKLEALGWSRDGMSIEVCLSHP